MKRLHIAAIVAGICCAAANPMRANAVAITYDLTGVLTADPVPVGDTLLLEDERTGTITPSDPSLGMGWNPVTIPESCVLDLDTGILTGTFVATFADGATLTGTIWQDDSAVTDVGPFTETLTFTGGTGEFSGATGSGSGSGYIGDTDYTVSGSGMLLAPAVPEPKPVWLLLGGLVLLTTWRGRSGWSKDGRACGSNT